MSARLFDGKRMVLKIGSALLTDPESGAIQRAWLDALADDVAEARERGIEVLIVSSGAISVGRRPLGLGSPKSMRLEEKQAAAATGQIRLAHAYQESLARHEVTVALVLLTLGDTEERRKHLNARNTMTTLLALGAVPIINENDTVATEEIRYGDNDRLAARVAQMVSADTLVLLSDIDGLYTTNPRVNDKAEHIAEVRELDARVQSYAEPPVPGDSSGGMLTKVEAAKIAFGAGCRMVIADGSAMNPLRAISNGARCTWFLPAATPRTARKRWIASAILSGGRLIADDGAIKALRSGRSLLPAGVTRVDGRFNRGDPVAICAADGREIARGLSAYGAEDARRIIGHRSGEIEQILGHKGRDVLIHRDDMVVTESASAAPDG